MFGRVNFRKDEKKKGEKMKRENFLEVVWLGGGVENDGGVRMFSSRVYQKVFSTKLKKKLVGYLMDE